MANEIIDWLLQSNEPAIRYKILVNILGESPQSKSIKRLQAEIKKSPSVCNLLSLRNANGRIPYHPYGKWFGSHWVLAMLSDLGYPAGDKSLIPLREQVYEWLFSEQHRKHIKTINGLVRRCVSQEGYAAYYLLKLGIADERTEELVAQIINWQWPDGGWNCDKNPAARNSSFMESLVPLRALALQAKLNGDRKAAKAAKQAAEIFLKRRLFKSQSDGRVIRESFIKLHYPCFFEYDILSSLKVMAEADFIGDPRCADALNFLEEKRLPDGGFPAEAKFYHRFKSAKISRGSLVDWGGTSRRHYNEWVTVDALNVLKKSNRLQL